MPSPDQYSTSIPRPVPERTGRSPPGLRPQSPTEGSWSRATSNARLASPIPFQTNSSSPLPTGVQRTRHNGTADRSSGPQTPLAGSSEQTTLSLGPGQSALASALHASLGNGSRQSSNINLRTSGEPGAAGNLAERPIRSNHGSFSQLSMQGQSAPNEDFDVIRRHLAGPSSFDPNADTAEYQPGSISRLHDRSTQREAEETVASSMDSEHFSSLRMQGGDITREIYRRTEAEEAARRDRIQRSQSLHGIRPPPKDVKIDFKNIKKPGGFRRDHIRRAAASPARGNTGAGTSQLMQSSTGGQPSFLTSNFLEFLTIYGHFAGQPVDEDETDSDDVSWQQEGEESGDEESDNLTRDIGERRPLLRRRTTKSRSGDSSIKKGAAGTVLILLKSFVGTGVLFMPRAFYNGGMLFSILVLLSVAILSYYCFLLLTTSRLKLGGSFAEMGEIAHGKVMRFMINFSLVISQVGFASAYIVFTSENLRAFILAVSHCATRIDIKWMVLMQMIVFLPLSLYRNLNRLAFVVYVADVFIILGLIYLYYFGISVLAEQHGVADIQNFNRHSWTLFIGTAIFTFEGIGLIIPIQDGMKKPQQLPKILGGVMVIITFIFTGMGALAYAAYGSKTETVILLNMPQDNKFVNGVQFIYSLAILLSTPLQIYPAISIMERGIFTKSGKFSKNIKWQKNFFRFLVVVMCAMIAWVGAGDLDKFVALVGSFACIPLVYIYPPLIHHAAVANRRWERFVDLVLCVFGIVLMAYTSVLTVSSWVGGTASKSRGYCDA